MIKVGGATEVEVKERIERVDDALNATRAAVEEGVVPGGGVALLKATLAINVKGDNEDQDAGIQIVRKALQAPIRQIAENAASKARSWSARSWTAAPRRSATTPRDEYGDMIEKGIIDPAKVVRTVSLTVQPGQFVRRARPRAGRRARRHRVRRAIVGRVACRGSRSARPDLPDLR